MRSVHAVNGLHVAIRGRREIEVVREAVPQPLLYVVLAALQDGLGKESQ